MFENVKESLQRRIVDRLGGVTPPKANGIDDMGFDVSYWDSPSIKGLDTYSTKVYHIERGHVRELNYMDRLALPTYTGTLLFQSGNINPTKTEWKIDQVLRTVARCAPWVRVYAGPRIFLQCSTDGISNPAGVAALSNDPELPSAILMRLDLNLRAFRSTLHHEIWHAVENDALNSRTVARLTKAVRLGTEYDGDAYLVSDIERRARAYQAYASLRDEMPEMRFASAPSKPEEDLSLAEIFEAVYSGDLARGLGIDFLGPFDAAPGKAAQSILASRGQTEDVRVDSRDAVLAVFSSLADVDFESDDYRIRSDLLGHLLDHDHYVRTARE